MNRTIRAVAALICAIALAGCTVGPRYQRPSAPAAAAYKELPPDAEAGEGWKVAQPKDDSIHGNWWEMFHDLKLNALEQQVNVSNQNIAASFAAFLQARALVTEARAQYFPTLTTSPGVTRGRQSATLAPSAAAGTGSAASSSHLYTDYTLPFDASWTPDLWGRVRNTVKGNVAAAQASAADLENTRLTAQAEVAVDYYELRSQDAMQQLLDATVVAYQESLKLTQALYETGIDTDEAVAQAEVQLRTTQAQATNLGIARAQYEHAIALLLGQPASTFSIAVEPLQADLPATPLSVPSQLLERRPDIAAGERLMAQANAQIGVATAAYYPTLTLSASAGFESSSLSN